MRLQMVQLSRKKSGLWAARKVIPSDVRDAYGKREEKKSWSAELSPPQAKQEYADWLAPIEAKIASLRASIAARTHIQPVGLTKRQCVALAGEWYRDLCNDREVVFTDTNAIWDWEVDREAILPQGEGGDHLRPIPLVTASQESLLASKGLILDESSSWVLQQEMLRLYLAFLDLMERRVDSDFGEDPVLKTLPEVLQLVASNDTSSQTSTIIRIAPAAQESLGGSPVSIVSMFEDYAAARQMVPHTVSKWRLAVRSLVEHLGHDDARRISRADLQSWFAKLQAEGRSLKTVAGTYRAAVARILKLAHDMGHISANPAQAIEVIGPRRIQTAHKSLTDSEAKIILSASLGGQPKGLSPYHALARRWVPWICAYTGARVNEITQLRAGDIRMEEGVWVFRITPEAGTVKTGKARSVPIHSHLIDQGLLAIKAGKDDVQPLFYNGDTVRSGSIKHPLYSQMGTKIAKWVRELGVTEVKSPNHGWRHRFKDVARMVDMKPEARDAAQGHAPRTEGETYGGEYPVVALRAEIEKYPRYDMDDDLSVR